MFVISKFVARDRHVDLFVSHTNFLVNPGLNIMCLKCELAWLKGVRCRIAREQNKSKVEIFYATIPINAGRQAVASEWSTPSKHAYRTPLISTPA